MNPCNRVIRDSNIFSGRETAALIRPVAGYDYSPVVPALPIPLRSDCRMNGDEDVAAGLTLPDTCNVLAMSGEDFSRR